VVINKLNKNYESFDKKENKRKVIYIDKEVLKKNYKQKGHR
jgi:hypothetical protein